MLLQYQGSLQVLAADVAFYDLLMRSGKQLMYKVPQFKDVITNFIGEMKRSVNINKKKEAEYVLSQSYYDFEFAALNVKPLIVPSTYKYGSDSDVTFSQVTIDYPTVDIRIKGTTDYVQPVTFNSTLGQPILVALMQGDIAAAKTALKTLIDRFNSFVLTFRNDHEGVVQFLDYMSTNSSTVVK